MIKKDMVGRFLMRQESERQLYIHKPEDDKILACLPNGDTKYHNFYIVYVLFEQGHSNFALSTYMPNNYEYGFDLLTIDEYKDHVKNHSEYVFREI